MHSIFNWDTHLYPPHNNSPVHLTTITKVLRSERITDWLENTTRLCSFIPDVGTHPPWTALPRIAWDRLNRLRTGVERFRSCLHKWGMSPSAACECGTDVQTVEHVVIHCPIHRPPYGVHGLTVLRVAVSLGGNCLGGSCPGLRSVSRGCDSLGCCNSFQQKFYKD